MFRKKIGLIKDKPGRFAARLLLGGAFCVFIAGCYLYWSAESGQATRSGGPAPLSRAAQAEGMRMSAEVLSAVLSKEAGRARQEDSANPDSDAALAATLNRLYPDLADSGYFVLWRGTVDVCSPLTPDTAGLDFGTLRDARGVGFVREMAELAGRGGGFYEFVLSGDSSGSPGPNRLFTAYTVPVAATDLHLTVWRPLDAFSLSLEAEVAENRSHLSLLGLCMAGLSFLGVSVLLRGFKD